MGQKSPLDLVRVVLLCLLEFSGKNYGYNRDYNFLEVNQPFLSNHGNELGQMFNVLDP